MTPSPNVAAKRQVAETSLLFLHAEIVDYNLRGDGARFYNAPPHLPPSDEAEVEADTEAETETETEAEAAAAAAAAAAVAGETSVDNSPAVLSAKRKRLEALGQDVGTRLAERHAHYRERLDQDLEMVKFICKDFWEATFRKQIDVLRTNHRGLYVLTDNNFHWVSSVAKTSLHQGAPEDYVVFPCGLICGALTRLGLRCRVTADLFPAPQGFRCSFNVQLIQS